jgi:hypothetical protein
MESFKKSYDERIDELRSAHEELATFKAELGQRMEGGLLNTILLLCLVTITSGASDAQAQLEKEKKICAEVGQESIRALEDGTRIRAVQTIDLLTCICSEAFVRYSAGQANCGHLRPRRSKGSDTKPHKEARE